MKKPLAVLVAVGVAVGSLAYGYSANANHQNSTVVGDAKTTAAHGTVTITNPAGMTSLDPT